MQPALAHGSHSSYVRGCRCNECRKAHREYAAARLRANPDPDSGYVDAGRSRAHLLYLAQQGLGVAAIQVATDLSRKIIMEVRNGKRTRVQKRTEKKMLAVTPDMALDRALVDATQTWLYIQKMLDAGVGSASIMDALGRVGPVTRIGATRVTVRTAARIQRLYARLLGEPASRPSSNNAQAVLQERGR